MLAVRDLEARQTAQGQRKPRGRPEGQIQGETERETHKVRQRERYSGLKTESEAASNPRSQKARRTRNSEAEREERAVGRNARRQRRKPWPAETQAPAENASDPSRFCLIWKILLRP